MQMVVLVQAARNAFYYSSTFAACQPKENFYLDI